jgi:uncharacterized repeat protein (TIGR01451 family)
MRGLVDRLVLHSLAMSAAIVLLSTIPRDLEAQPTGGTAGRDLTVEITKAGALLEIPTRTNVAFVVTVSNIRSAQASNVLVNVNFPVGFTSLSGAECTFNRNVASCTTASLGGNSQKTFRISSTAPSTISGTSQPVTLTAVVDPNNTVEEGTGGNNNNSDNLTINVVTRADLNAGIGGQSATVQVAPDLVFVVTVDNEGDRAASNLLVRSTLPKDVAFVRVEENRLGSCAQNTTASNGALNVNCTLSSLPAGGNGHVRIVGRLVGMVPDGVQVTSAVNVDPNNSVPERNENDNTAFLITTMRAISDVQIVFNGAIVAGTQNPSLSADCGAGSRNTIEATVTIRNNGPQASGPTIVTARWPAGITAPNTAISGVPAGACFDRCDVPALKSGQSVVVKLFGGAFDVRLSGPGNATFTVDPAQTLFDSVVGNNSVTGTVCSG